MGGPLGKEGDKRLREEPDRPGKRTGVILCTRGQRHESSGGCVSGRTTGNQRTPLGSGLDKTRSEDEAGAPNQ